jgi:hypothetical protein
MSRHLAALALVVLTGCTTIDTSRPIAKGTGLWWGTGQQDGRTLEAWSARKQLLEFEVSRPAAQRSLTESYVGMGTVAAGLAVNWGGIATRSNALKNVGLGVALLSLIPTTMAWSDYMKAIDAYNSRFEPAPAASRATLQPYLSVVSGGGEAGLAGRF